MLNGLVSLFLRTGISEKIKEVGRFLLVRGSGRFTSVTDTNFFYPYLTANLSEGTVLRSIVIY